MSLLTLIQDVCNVLGEDEPDIVVASTEKIVKQLLAIAELVGNELNTWGKWPGLTVQGTITLVSAQADYPLPSDFDRLVRNTVWNQNEDRPLDGPSTNQEWMLEQEGVAGVSLDQRYRFTGQTGNKISIQPTPTTTDAGQVLVYEYLSKNWIYNGTTTYTRFNADSDSMIFPEDLMAHGIRYYYRYNKGLRYEADMDLYLETRPIKFAQKRGAKILSLNPPTNGVRMISNRNLPESGYTD